MKKKRSHPAVRFLWIVAGLTVLIIAGAIAYRIFEQDLMRWVMVPKTDFEAVPMPEGASYAQAGMWISRPGLTNDPSEWMPEGSPPPPEARASVFFVHPTSFLESSAWNASLDDAESQQRARLFVRSQASAFNSVGDVWAPKYRQATFGAFLTGEQNARRALDFAYRDVVAAFEQFVKDAPQDRPIILAAHSQGSLHLMRLLQEVIADSPEKSRIVAAYVIGWPISVSADLPSMPLPACETADQAGCILSWQSFAEPADPQQVTEVYDESTGPTGQSRAGTAMLCTNPLTGGRGGDSPASANLGTLVPNGDLSDAELRSGVVSARCDVRGFLLIGDNDRLPEMGNYVLPGNNYHVYDYALFWANVRADAERRLKAYLGRR